MYNIDYFTVAPNTASGLAWSRDVFDSRGRQTKTRAGMMAGSRNVEGYFQVVVGGEYFYVHKIIWELTYGIEVPEGWVVDHLDGNPSNNAPSNLEAKPADKNARNMRMRSDNTSGFTGVDFYRGAKYDYVRARWTEDGKQRNKCFRIDVYGEDLAFQYAVAARTFALKTMNACGAGYTERHGK